MTDGRKRADLPDCNSIRITITLFQLFWGMCGCLLPSAALSENPPLSHEERLGKRIYLQGTGTSAVEADFVNSGIRAPGSEYPCVKCHGEAGKGGREAGVSITDISPEAPVMQRYRQYNAAGSIEKLAAAVSNGIRPDGATLHPAMPRYQMSMNDISNLLAYLKRLGNEPVPGVSDREIHIGMQLPSDALTAAASRDVRRLLEAYFSQVNQAGGIYGRKLILDILPAPDSSNPEAVSSSHDAVFCLIAYPPAPLTGSSQNNDSLDEAVPVIAPLMIFPESGSAATSGVFYMYAGIRDQGRVLADFLGEKFSVSGRRVALLYTEDAVARAGAEGVQQRTRSQEIQMAVIRSIQAHDAGITAITDELQRKKIEQVIYFGPAGAYISLGKALRARRMRPVLLGSAELLGNSVTRTEGFSMVYLASSTGMPDMLSQGMSDYSRLVRQSGLPAAQNPFLLNAYAGANVLVEALKENGRGVSRISFIRVLESDRSFRTGVGPDLRFGNRQYRGTSAVMILSFDPRTGSFAAHTPFREAH